MSSNTQPLPAAQLLKLADTMANTHTASPDFFEARDAYEAARAASPVTLEEFLIVQEEEAQWCRAGADWATASQMTHKHALVLIDARNNARRLAGEGGGQ